METIPSVILGPLIIIPVVICLIGFTIMFVIFKFTSFMISAAVRIVAAIVVMLGALGSGFYLHHNPDAIKSFAEKKLSGVVKAPEKKRH